VLKVKATLADNSPRRWLHSSSYFNLINFKSHFQTLYIQIYTHTVPLKMVMGPADSEGMLARTSRNFPDQPTYRLTQPRIQLLQIICKNLQHLQLNVWTSNEIIRLQNDSWFPGFCVNIPHVHCSLFGVRAVRNWAGQGRIQWWVLVNTITNPQIPWKSRNCLITFQNDYFPPN
jgi:hypothetical protein